jgi:hypothetical protein
VYQWKAFRQLARVDMLALQAGMNVGKGDPDLDKACRALYPDLFSQPLSTATTFATASVNGGMETPDPTAQADPSGGATGDDVNPGVQPDAAGGAREGEGNPAILEFLVCTSCISLVSACTLACGADGCTHTQTHTPSLSL